ncbi:transcriptional regulator [Candidatus Woesearchaeota archaeon CG10_big_fil_rev_8_21_14_0_10_30_7]|nr:MAG: transcriptional regulator [Candidatus Woesearchaeota archaeon CG10_big_fil_rev_8_21_14_0_10_30_7]
MDKQIYELHASMCKIFSNPLRLEILNILRNKEMTVSKIVQLTKVHQASISQNLSLMKTKGILSSRKEGKNTYYKLSNQKIIQAFDIIRDVLYEQLKKKNKLAKELGRSRK